jgi:2-phosphosulfolactate phosphatase
MPSGAATCVHAHPLTLPSERAIDSMPRVAIDCFHEHLEPIPDGVSIVAIDVIRATTTAITAAAMGRRVFPAGSIEASVRLAADLDRPILAGELGGVQPYGFDLQNSPTQMLALEDSARPIILLSTSGTRLIAEAVQHGVTYICCLRNTEAQALHLAAGGSDVLILGADSRGEFRDEDQLCAARIARFLLAAGYGPADTDTEAVIARFGDAPDDAFIEGRSARYLRDTGQDRDLAFVLEHVNDLRSVFVVEDKQVRELSATAQDRPGKAIEQQAGPQGQEWNGVIEGEPGRLADATK